MLYTRLDIFCYRVKFFSRRDYVHLSDSLFHRRNVRALASEKYTCTQRRSVRSSDGLPLPTGYVIFDCDSRILSAHIASFIGIAYHARLFHRAPVFITPGNSSSRTAYG